MAQHKAEKENKHLQETNYLYFLTRAYVIMVLVIYPLYVGFAEYKYDDIVHSKAIVFWAVSVIFFIVFALFYAAHRLGLKRTEQPLPFWKTFTVPDWAALAFLLVLTISLLTSPYKSIAWYGTTNRNDGYLTYFCMVMSYFIISRWYKPKWLDMILFAIGSSSVCIIGFLQFYGYDFMNLFPYDRYNKYYSGFTIFFRSTIGNIDFVSAYVCLAIVIFSTLYIKTQHPVKFLYIITSAMNFMIMVIAGADSGRVGLLGAMVLLIPYWLTDKKSFGKLLILCSSWGMSYVIHHISMIKLTIPYWRENREMRSSTIELFDNYSPFPLMPLLIASLILLCIGLILITPMLKFWPNVKISQVAGFCALGIIILGGLAVIEIIGKRLPESNTIHQAREVMHGNINDDFGSGRIFVWRKSLEQFSDGHPLFGTGSDTFYQAFGEENQLEASEIRHEVFDKAHNDFVQILLCNGIFALVSYLVLIFSIVILSIKKAFYDDFLLVALGGALAYIIQSFFGIDTLIVTPIYWLTLAIVRQRQSELV